MDVQTQYLVERIRKLEHEIEVLRFYGNKDCTAMADEVLSEDMVTPSCEDTIILGYN